MAKRKMGELRDHLFDTLEKLKDKENPMELARALAVAEVAKVLVETAKVEVSFLKVRRAVAADTLLGDDEAFARPPKRLNGPEVS